MIIKTNKTIQLNPILNSQEEDNIVKINSNLTGGTDPSYAATFSTKDFVLKNYEIDADNTDFELLISDLVEDLADVVFIEIFCVETTDSKKITPVKFQVDMIKGDDEISLGKMSNFSLNNIEDYNSVDVKISGIVVTGTKKANVTVLITLK